MPLYSFVNLFECDDRFVIKTAWCHGTSSAKVRSRGSRPNKAIIVFFSPDPKSAPDFTLPIKREFTASRAACYKGYILKTFGEYDFSSQCAFHKDETQDILFFHQIQRPQLTGTNGN